MKLVKKLMLLGAIVANTAIVSQVGAEITNSVETFGGWRRDKLDMTLHGHEFKGAPADSFYRDFADDINLGQFGLRGVFGLPQSCTQTYDPCCESFFNFSNLYVRWSATWGWGSGGHYNLSSYNIGEEEEGQFASAKPRWANSQDYDIALGLLIPVSCEFGLAPVGGYNYDRLKYSIRRFSSDSIDDPSELNGSRVYARWEGPYVGFDAGYKLCDFLIAAGYEYHWVTNFRGQFKVPGDYLDTASGDFITDNRSGSNGYANVAHVDLNYNWCGWDLGLNFKYRYFRLNSGRSRIQIESDGDTTYTTVKAHQQTYEVNAVIGLNF